MNMKKLITAFAAALMLLAPCFAQDSESKLSKKELQAAAKQARAAEKSLRNHFRFIIDCARQQERYCSSDATPCRTSQQDCLRYSAPATTPAATNGHAH